MKKTIALLLLSIMTIVAVGCGAKETPQDMVDPPTYEGESEITKEEDTTRVEPKASYNFDKFYTFSDTQGHFIVSGIYNDFQNATVFLLDNSGKVINHIEGNLGAASGNFFSSKGLFPVYPENPDAQLPNRPKNLVGIMSVKGEYVIEPVDSIESYNEGHFFLAKSNKYDDFGILSVDIKLYNNEGEFLKSWNAVSDSDAQNFRANSTHAWFNGELINQNGDVVANETTKTQPGFFNNYTFSFTNDFGETMIIYDENMVERTYSAAGDEIIGGFAGDFWIKYKTNEHKTLLLKNNEVVHELEGTDWELRGKNTLINKSNGEVYKIAANNSMGLAGDYHSIESIYLDDFLVAKEARENGEEGYTIVIDYEGNKIINSTHRLAYLYGKGSGKNVDNEDVLLDFKFGVAMLTKDLEQSVLSYLSN